MIRVFRLVRGVFVFAIVMSVGAVSPVEPVHFYTVNLMWINRKFDPNQQYIYPACSEEQLMKKLLQPVYKWALVTQGGVIQLWFDSLLTPKKAVQKTVQLLQGYVAEHPELAPILFRDVRELPIVQQHPIIFSDKLPIFFRVDLLRVIAQVHDVSTGVTPYFVYADLDIKPLSREELFDEEAMQNLKTFGLVLAYCPKFAGFENNFQMLSCHNKKMLEAMNYLLIELNIQRAYNALKDTFYVHSHKPSLEKFVKKGIGDNRDQEIKVPQDARYSLNVMHINGKLEKNQQYIHPGINKEELQDEFFQPLFALAEANPNSTVQLWFDSEVTPERAVHTTITLINEYVQSHCKAAPIIVRDVRDIPYVRAHPDLFSSEIFLAVRKAMLVVLASFADLSEGRTSYFVYGDLFNMGTDNNLGSFLQKEGLIEQAIKDIKQYGAAKIIKKGMSGIWVMTKQEQLFERIMQGWLEPIDKKCTEAQQGLFCYGLCCKSKMFALQQILYGSYAPLFSYFYHHAGFGKLSVGRWDSSLGKVIFHEYEQQKDGLVPFGPDRTGGRYRFVPYEQLPEASIGSIWMPRKRVSFPPATLLYDDADPVRLIRNFLKEL